MAGINQTMDPEQVNALADSLAEAVSLRIKSDLMAHIDVKVDPISSALSKIQSSLSTINEHVTELEMRVSRNEDNITDVTARVNQLEKENSYLLQKMDDQENRNRASNLKFINVPESSEGRDTIEFMTRLIPQLLGLENFPSSLAIERAHRSPTTRQINSGTTRKSGRDGPRPILIRLLHFQDKVKILRLAREKKELRFNGSRVSIYPDFSAPLEKRRRAFDPVKKKLREMKLPYVLRYPCTLCVEVNDNELQFTDHKAAEAKFMPPRSSSMSSSCSMSPMN